MNTHKNPGEVLDFEEYVRTRQDALLRSARRLVGDPLEAQDLLQTALLRTYRRWDRIADKQLADAYLRRVMINTRTGWWRAHKLQELPIEQFPDAPVGDCAAQHADRALVMDIMSADAPTTQRRDAAALGADDHRGDGRRHRLGAWNGQEHSAPCARPAP